MSASAAIFVAALILGATAIAMVLLLASRRRQAQEEEMARAASTRSWQFSSRSENNSRIHRWTGTTDGVTWQAESIRATSRRNNHRRHIHVARWHGNFSPGINKPILCIGVPKGKEAPAFSVAQGDGMLAQLAQKAAGFALDKAVDVHFGKELGDQVDAAALQRLEAATIPGFTVMAADKEEGGRMLAEDLGRALTDATADISSVLSDDHRPWILLLPASVSLARTEKIRDVNDVDRYIRAGLALSRMSRFARPFA